MDIIINILNRLEKFVNLLVFICFKFIMVTLLFLTACACVIGHLILQGLKDLWFKIKINFWSR